MLFASAFIVGLGAATSLIRPQLEARQELVPRGDDGQSRFGRSQTQILQLASHAEENQALHRGDDHIAALASADLVHAHGPWSTETDALSNFVPDLPPSESPARRLESRVTGLSRGRTMDDRILKPRWIPDRFSRPRTSGSSRGSHQHQETAPESSGSVRQDHGTQASIPPRRSALSRLFVGVIHPARLEREDRTRQLLQHQETLRLEREARERSEREAEARAQREEEERERHVQVIRARQQQEREINARARLRTEAWRREQQEGEQEREQRRRERLERERLETERLERAYLERLTRAREERKARKREMKQRAIRAKEQRRLAYREQEERNAQSREEKERERRAALDPEEKELEDREWARVRRMHAATSLFQASRVWQAAQDSARTSRPRGRPRLEADLKAQAAQRALAAHRNQELQDAVRPHADEREFDMALSRLQTAHSSQAAQTPQAVQNATRMALLKLQKSQIPREAQTSEAGEIFNSSPPHYPHDGQGISPRSISERH